MASSCLQLHSVKKFNNYNREQEIINAKEKNIPKKYNIIKKDSVQINKESLKYQELIIPGYQDNMSSLSYKHSKHNYYTVNHKNKKLCRNKPYTNYNNFIPKQKLEECTTSKNHNYKQDVKCSFENKREQMITVETQSKKTPVSLLNEWSMCGGKSNDNIPVIVSYELTALEGSTHKPTFIYMCRVLNEIAMGEGESKKEAKQNSAANMLRILFNNNSAAHNDKVITSTTTTNNFVINTNDTDNSEFNLQSMDVNERERKHSNFKKVQAEYCIMNPVGALQEMSTAYKWAPPTYNTQKLQPSKADHKISYKVICCVLFLQTEGHGSTKQEAKRNSARLMNQQVHNFGIDKLNEIKCSTNKNIIPFEINEDGSTKNKECEKPIWNSAKMFRTYFKIASNISTTDTHNEVVSPLNYSNNSDNMTPQEHKMKLEKSIIDLNSYSDGAVKQLEFLGQQLGFIISYVTVDIKKIDTNQDETYTILLQVTSKPVIVTTALGYSINEALEEAAKSILIMMRSMMLFTTSTSLNNNKQNNLC